MDGNADGLRALARYSKLPLERIRYFPSAGPEVIRAIPRGVLFLMAFWSGSAVRAFAMLTELLARLPAETLELVVADLDGSPELYEVPEFKGNVHGSGETAWIRDGKIIATSGRGFHPECFEPNTLALLSMR